MVGLGPAGSAHLSAAVAAVMANARCCYLRTTQHPAAEAFEAFESFDHLYESADTFAQVYRDIVDALVEAAMVHAPEPIVYAVPGSPLVAEQTVALLREDERVDVTIIPGLSFLDLAWDRLALDPLHEGVRLVDAEQFSTQTVGERGPFLVAQCWSKSLLSEIKLSGDDEDDDRLPPVTLLWHLGLPEEEVRTVDWWDMDRAISPDHLTSLYIPVLNSALNAERELARLETLVHTLRDRCPWDRVQTHSTLIPHLIEESYEVVDALSALSSVDHPPDAADFAHLEEELGDLLFQIVFHARLAQEEGQFTLAGVARGVHDKLVHRHPHVFGDVDAATPEEVVGNWEAIKKEEKGRRSVTEGIPAHLPSLMLMAKLQRKARSVGISPSLQVPDLIDLVTTLQEHASRGQSDDADAPLVENASLNEALVGDLLFEITDLARRVGVDAEQALRTRAASYRERILTPKQCRHRPNDQRRPQSANRHPLVLILGVPPGRPPRE